jgi:predicted nucleotidyltransferase
MGSQQEHSAAVVPVSAARAQLTGMLRAFRADPNGATPVVFGSHRVPEAVLLPYEQFEALRRGRSVEPRSPREQLAHHRAVIERLAQASRLGRVQVFGSVARGDDGPDSDIDLLVDPEPGASYFEFAQFALDAEELLGRHVDVVSRRALDPVRDAEILREAVDL